MNLSCDKKNQLDFFLASVEKRAYRTALFTAKKSQDALDIVQDAMTRLVQHYGENSVDEWPLLFQRILQNRIMDWCRSKQKQKRFFWQKTDSGVQIDDHYPVDELLETMESPDKNPVDLLVQQESIERIIAAIDVLPLRQRQAFLLRAWEGFNLEQTAEVMECSVGSVKTHYFRAVQKLQELFG